MRQPLFRAVVVERIAVEARQPVSRAEPEKAARVAHDFVDNVVRQTVGGGESLERQPLGPYTKTLDQQQSHQTRCLLNVHVLSHFASLRT